MTAEAALAQAVQRYFDLIYDGDVVQFGAVFHDSARLHGVKAGAITMIPAADYKASIGNAPSPRSQGAPRQEEILFMDVAAADQALVKVRVRIGAILFLDYLAYHCIEGRWLITAKSFHVEKRFQSVLDAV